ncbi:MAG: DUF4351 domain-containing protein [Thermomicrobiales bacterium]
MAQQRRRRTSRRDLDAAWKHILRELFAEFVAFALPDLHRAIDWSREPEFMDKELQAVARRAATGQRRVDLLAKVWQLSGEEQWVFIHVEVQARKEEQFAERMYLYHTLLFLRHRRPIVSTAILTDPRADWRPDEYAYNHWGCRLLFGYPVLKLLELWGREEELKQSRNPFAQVALAQLAVLTSRGQQEPLIATRLDVMRHLLRAGQSEVTAVAVLDFLDIVMNLPDDVIDQIDKQFAEETAMARSETPYRPMTSWERRGLRQGREEGREEGIVLGQRGLLEQMLERRWGPLGEARQSQLRALAGDRLVALGEAIFDFDSLDDLDRWLAANS